MKSLLRFARYLTRHSVVVALVVLAGLLSAATALPVPLLVAHIIDVALPSRDVGLLAVLVAAICAAWIVSHGLMILGAYGAAWLRESVHVAVRQDLFEHLQAQPARFFEARETGGLVSRLTNDVAAVQGLVGDRVFEAVGELVYLAGGAVILLRLDWKLGLVSLLVLPVVSAVFGALRKRLHAAQLRLQESQEELGARLTESLAGIRVIQAHGLEAREARRLRERSLQLKAVQLRKQLVTSIAAGLGVLLTLVPIASVVWGYGGWRVLTGGLSVGVLVAFYHYLGTFFRPMGVLFRLAAEALTAMAAAERIFDVLDTSAELPEPEGGARPLPTPIRGELAIDGVDFDYGDGRLALRDVSLELAAGEVVGLVGPSGSGKTTLAHLLVRFADPTRGEVRLDGVPLRDLDVRELRRHVGLVGQEVFLFNDTVRENLRVARPDATDDEVEAAARTVGADRFIEALPEGYDTVIGERGARLSGGQRQMIALGRVLLHDPEVLLFDEATSALDPVSEARLHHALETATRGRTTLVIAHRRSTLRLASQLVVLDGGQVVGQGTHDELLESVPLYRELSAAQEVG